MITTKYYSERTIRDFIKDCQDINGSVDLAKFDRYLNKRPDFEAARGATITIHEWEDAEDKYKEENEW